MPRSAASAAFGLVVLFVVRHAHAGESTMSEPVIEENVTDIDGREFPTIEFDFTPEVLKAQHSNNGLLRTGLEVEWRPLDRLGVGAELDASSLLTGPKPTGAVHFAPRAALSYVFMQDFERRIFLQAEVAGRYDGGLEFAFTDPTEIALRYWAGVRGATHFGNLDVRSALLAEAGGSSAHAPVHASGAALYTLVGESTRGAFGAEVIADFAREAPLVAAPEGEFLARVFGKPVRFELAVPVTVGAKGNDASYGVAFRLVLEPDE